MSPELSIIVPCYNYAHFLCESIDSILNQDYRDYELLLIDDGSTDKTWKIMQMYAKKSKQIRIFKNSTNQGIFKVNERGWSKATGKYLHFFSADDLYRPTFLSKIMEHFHKNPHLGLVCTDVEYFKDQESSKLKPLAGQIKPQSYSPQDIVSVFKTGSFWIPGLSCVVKNEVLKSYGHLDPKLENISDWYCFHKIALFEGVGYIPQALIAMRTHDQTYTSIVKRDKKRRRASYAYLLQKLLEEKQARDKFKQSGLLDFVFKELRWKARLNPRYWRYFTRRLL